MLYLPAEPYGMWDTWLFPDGDEYHLFFLQSEPGTQWNALGRAVSRDLLHWRALPPIPTRGPEDAWDYAPTLTGMTVKAGERYALFYGSATHGQQIGVMFSEDLRTWQKYAHNPVLVPRGPHYAEGGDWRDLCTFHEPAEGVWHGYVCAQARGTRGQARPAIPEIKDKTLVAWVYLANREQRGGSALTLNLGRTPGDVFDGIVFGERRPGVWMSGSDSFRRTPADQADYPEETAGPETLVQVAIAYEGNTVTIYRDGESCAEYTVDNQATFGDGTAVVMGLRHLGCGRGGTPFLAGAIEEARVYDVALTGEQVRALRLGEVSDPAPVGWWTFEDGTATDLAGNFPPGELYNGARIEGGRLHLDGVDDYLATPSEPPRKVSCIAHVVSDNLVEWRHLAPAFASDDFVNMEVPDYFGLNGYHYLLFSTAGSRKDTSGRRNASGTYYAMAENRDGPYVLPARPLLLGSGQGRFTNYVGRTIPFGDTRMLYHHTVGGPVTFCTGKLVRQDHDGTLWLQYWSGLDGLETRVLFGDPGQLGVEESTGPGAWSAEGGVVKGQTPGQPSVLWLPVTAGDAMITADVEMDSAEGAGIVFRWAGEAGLGVIIRRTGDAVELVQGHISARSVATTLLDEVRGLPRPDGPRRIRVMMRRHLADAYVDDRWLFTIPLVDQPQSGRVGLCVQGGAARFGHVRVAELEPLEPSAP